jgi:hypothetical protein
LASAQPEPPGPNGGPCWFNADYLFWFRNQPRSVPLLTTGPAASRGIIGQPGTTVLFGGSDGGDFGSSGARISGGTWLCGMCAVEGTAFILGQHSVGFTASGLPVLARPIFNTLTGREDTHLISLPGAFAGSAVVSLTTRMWGAEANLVYNPYHSTGNYPEWIVGFRFAELDDALDISDNTRILANGVSNFNGVPVFSGNSISTTDHFGTRSEFYGGQIGVRSRCEFCCCLFLELVGKVAFGDTHQEENLIGTTTLVPPVGPSRTTGVGLLALSSNSGRHSRDDFSVLPEGNITLGCWITPCIKAYAGFNLLYWSDVLRAGDVVNRAVNPTLDPRSNVFGQAGGTAAPTPSLGNDRDLWLYGVTVGLGFEF